MRVLLQGRSARSLAATPGGDQVQIEETARALRAGHSVDAEITSELEPDLRGFDAVHLFGLVRPQEVWLQARNAYRQGVPIALSTVYCDVWEFETRARGGSVGWLARHSGRNVMEALKAGARGARSHEWSKGVAALYYKGFQPMQREVLQLAGVFLPNSRSEWSRLTADLSFSCDDERVVVVPNGVNLDYLTPPAPGEVPRELERFRDCVLCIARVEGRKNQLALVEAVAGTGLQLVLAGKPADNQPGYVRRVSATAAQAGNVHVLGPISEDTKRHLYSLAKVHALPSWIETTGLSSLEAAMLDCSLVVSPNGDTREYFSDDAEYCDPSNVESIRDAIVRAWHRPPSSELSVRIASSMTWDAAAAATVQGYTRLLNA
jgi:glycosyltransferase involved in cell wall biosynthesis